MAEYQTSRSVSDNHVFVIGRSTRICRWTCAGSDYRVGAGVLTKNPAHCLAAIRGRGRKGGGVAVRELAKQMGYRSQKRPLLLELETRGFIRRIKGQDRRIEIFRPIRRFATFRFDALTKVLQRFPRGKRA